MRKIQAEADLPAVLPTSTPSSPVFGGLAPHVVVGTLFVVLCASPLLFTSSGFMVDFTNWIWFGAVRGYQLEHGQLFSYFVTAHVVGALNPFWAFYGGPMFTAVGALSDVLGHNAIVAFDILGVAALGSAYVGTFWIGRLCSLSRTSSHFPAICVVTSAYWITDLYGRGDWAEFVATSSIPIVVASSLAILRSPRLTLWPTVAFCASFFFFTGSHNITLLWGITIAATLVGLLWLFNRSFSVTPKAIGRLLGLALLVAFMNAWYLVPDVLFASRTQIAHYPASSLAGVFAPYNAPSMVFDPLRKVAANHFLSQALFVQAPIWFLGWAALGLALAATQRPSRRVLRSALAIAIVLAVILGLNTEGATPDLPGPWSAIQFPFRLGSYTVLLIAALVIVALIGFRRMTKMTMLARRGLFALLLMVTAMSTALAVWQLWVPKTLFNASHHYPGVASLRNRYEATASITTPPQSFDFGFDYGDSSQPVTSVATGRFLALAPAQVAGSGVKVTVPETLDPGIAPIVTNIVAGPEFIAVGGDFRRDGRSMGGLTVIARKANVGHPARLVLHEASPGIFLFLRVLSLSATFALAALVVLLAVWRRPPI